MSDKLVLHRAMPNGRKLPDWEFFWDGFAWAIDAKTTSYTVEPDNKGLFALSKFAIRGSKYTLIGELRWSRIHATGFTLPDGTEVVLPRRKT